jgi:hypothetical protein
MNSSVSIPGLVTASILGISTNVQAAQQPQQIVPNSGNKLGPQQQQPPNYHLAPKIRLSKQHV